MSAARPLNELCAIKQIASAAAEEGGALAPVPANFIRAPHASAAGASSADASFTNHACLTSLCEGPLVPCPRAAPVTG
jgi:hypothetical protein